MKILIIEDDQIIANIYRNKFVLDGFEAETARDGDIGLDLVRSFRPDAVLVDLALPRVTGLEVIRKLRAENDFKEMPIVVFSNTYLSTMLEEAWKAGATKCLSKANCTPRQVIDAVRTTLKNNGAGTSPKAAGRAKGGANSEIELPKPEVDSDAEFQAQLYRDFLADLPRAISGLRTVLQSLFKAENEGGRIRHIQELYNRTHTLSSNAGIAGAMQIALMADALEALLKELQDKPKNINISTLRTVASAVDFMALLFEHAPKPGEPLPHAEVLVVDDEAISRRAVIFALEKAQLKSVSVDDPVKALDLLSQKKFDLVFLDVDMPHMNGFELCTKLRTLPAYAKTP
ncbi:MAG TPA: response regulator, partial [Candidatus Polarisedimenticolia bacterium]|nr:response regulator [Candidatus Polarisedimenticolia bacterium]